MANGDWYVLRVRRGFKPVVVQRLRKLNLEVFIPERKAASPQDPHYRQDRSAGYVYCRFTQDNLLSVTSLPGVLDIVGTLDPLSFDENLSAPHMGTS